MNKLQTVESKKIGNKVYLTMGPMGAGIDYTRKRARELKREGEIIIEVPLTPYQQKQLQKFEDGKAIA